MKKLLYAICFSMLLVCCQSNLYEQIAVGEPIMPVRMHSDSVEIVLTDYVPTLIGSNVERLARMSVMSIENDGRISEIPFTDGKTSFSIAVLPNKPFRTGLITTGSNRHKVSIQLPSEEAQIVAYIQNMPISAADIKNEGNGKFTIHISKRIKGRSFLRIFAADATNLYNDLLIPLQDSKPVLDARQLTRHDAEGQVLYSLMVDRFANGNANNDWKMNSPEVLDIVDYQGGDFAGITQKIEEGFFDSLGINTIWVSPITQNPWDAWGKYEFKNGNKYDSTKLYTKFSGYHGYWPIYATRLDKRFGTEAEFRELLSTAHAHNINVILDYVANHMHINSPTYQQHPDWHTDSILPDGRRNFELWDEARLTTWFDRHIPTLDLERADICEAMTDSALYWLENFELDGFRHDACKHIPEGYWRLLTQKMKTRFPGRAIWMIGETYGSPQLIGSYVKSGMLNAQFDFNVYFAIRDALVLGKSFETVNATILESLAAYGAHHTMGNISGNHDQIRFASMAGEAIGLNTNGKEEGWTSDVGIGNADLAYQRTLTQEVINLTIPGVPCIYQGDEYAEVGGNDPDNRHMMRFDSLSAEQEAFRRKVRECIALRRHNMALIYGDYIPVVASQDTLIYQRVYMDNVVQVTITRDSEPVIEIVDKHE